MTVEKDIIKKYGDILLDASYFIDNPPKVISVSPKIDIGLGGGIPEGSLVILTGPEKIGKTVTALQFCKNAQDCLTDEGTQRKIFFGNVEGRLKKRDLEGIRGLDFDPERFKIVGSTKGNILSGEKYVSIFDDVIHNEPYAIGIIDSFSALAAQEELTNNYESVQVAPMTRVLAKFTRKFANVLPINKVTLVGITHLMANIQSFGKAKAKTEKSGNALKYAQDVKLWATHKEPLKQGETQIGQKVHWTVENSALGPPGQKIISYIKYGTGIWKEYEIVELAKDFGLIEAKGTWLTLPSGTKMQGIAAMAEYLENEPNAYSDLKNQVYEMVGFKNV